MRLVLLAVVVPAFAFAAGQSEAMPIAASPAPASKLIVPIAGGCGPGLVRGRLGTCLKRRAVFSHGRIVRKGCGKPIGATGQRTPC